MKTPHRSIRSEQETTGQFWQRIRNNGARKPLRSLKELAAEFEVTSNRLSAMMRHDPNGPRGVYSTGGNGRGRSKTPRNTWFDPDIVRAWWKTRKEKNND